MSTTIALTKPITAHDQQLSSLELREPNATDVMDIGYPFLVLPGDDNDTKLELRPKVVGKYVVRLAGIPPSSVAQLAIPDLQALQAVVMVFFGKSAEEVGLPTSP